MDRPDTGQPPRATQGLPHGDTGNGGRRVGEGGRVEHHTGAFGTGDSLEQRVRLPSQMGGVLGEEPGGAGEPLAQGGVEPGLQIGQQLVAHTVAEIPKIAVRGVLPPAETPIAEMGEHLLA